MSVSDTPVGFAIVPNWLVRDHSIDRNIIALYVALSSRAGRRGVCWPSYELLAAEAGMSRATVGRTLTKMREMALVDWFQEVTPKGRRNCYLLNLDMGGSSHSEQMGRLTMSREEEPVEEEPSMVTYSSTPTSPWDDDGEWK